LIDEIFRPDVRKYKILPAIMISKKTEGKKFTLPFIGTLKVKYAPFGNGF
jgi:hypothetical protein